MLRKPRWRLLWGDGNGVVGDRLFRARHEALVYARTITAYQVYLFRLRAGNRWAAFRAW